MQKEISLNQTEPMGDDTSLRATPETDNFKSGGSEGAHSGSVTAGEPEIQTAKGEDNRLQFEELIKGPYKEAFAQKVQGIINKRFKEQKTAEAKAVSPQGNEGEEKINSATQPASRTSGEPAENTADPLPEQEDPTYKALIAAGVDADTAYRVLHFDELMDSSVRYGAELAAKKLVDSIRSKAARPGETALSQRSFAAKKGAAGLTPEKRKELAKKALMGEQIGF